LAVIFHSVVGLTDTDLERLGEILHSLKVEKGMIDRLLESSSIELQEYIDRINYTVTIHMEKIAAVIGPESCKEVFGIYPGDNFLSVEPSKESIRPSIIPLVSIFIFFIIIIWTLLSLL
jgi:hypothetical protein